MKSSYPEVLCEKGVLKNFANSKKNICGRVSFLITLQASGHFIKKDTSAKVFSYKFLKNTFLCFYTTSPVVSFWIWITFCCSVTFSLRFLLLTEACIHAQACICLLGKGRNNDCWPLNPWNTLPSKQILKVINRNLKTRWETC